jgi:hypothetical protein
MYILIFSILVDPLVPGMELVAKRPMEVGTKNGFANLTTRLRSKK